MGTRSIMFCDVILYTFRANLYGDLVYNVLSCYLV